MGILYPGMEKLSKKVHELDVRVNEIESWLSQAPHREVTTIADDVESYETLSDLIKASADKSDAITKEKAVAAAVIFSGADIMSAWKKSKLSHLQLITTNKRFRALPRAVWDQILDLHQTIHPYETDWFDLRFLLCRDECIHRLEF